LITIKKAEGAEGERDEFVSTDTLLTLIDNNRTRIRTLAGIVLTVCGLLLSTSFVVLFFILKSVEFHVPRAVPILLLASSVTLTCAIVCSVLSALLPMPVSVLTKLELVDLWGRTYRREYSRVVLSVCLLLIAIMLFAVALGIFGLAVIK
jgi:hypothetical protein